jgi:hypothetical protein
MGWLGLFRASTRRSKTGVSQEDHRRLAAAVSQVKARVSNLDAQLGTIHLTLHKHDDEIAACRDLNGQHSNTLKQLEELVGNLSAQPDRYCDRSVGAMMAAPVLPVVATATYAPPRRLDLDRFSEQQKRLLSAFFQNRDREMSYADLAAVLGKSVCTVKNQMNQIRHKADLFDCAVGPQSRNLFRLKDDLKVEKLLKGGRPTGRPISMAGADRSDGDQIRPSTEHAVSQPRA